MICMCRQASIIVHEGVGRFRKWEVKLVKNRTMLIETFRFTFQLTAPLAFDGGTKNCGLVRFRTDLKYGAHRSILYLSISFSARRSNSAWTLDLWLESSVTWHGFIMCLLPIWGVPEVFPQFLIDIVAFLPISGVSAMSNDENYGKCLRWIIEACLYCVCSY